MPKAPALALKDTPPISGDDAGSLNAYFAEVRRTPLLTKDEELRLGRAVLAAQREQRKGARARQAVLDAGESAKRKLVESNLRLVVSVARRYRNSQFSLLDRIQEGNLGLMRAAEKYDYRKGYRFSTYAVWWIRQSITRGMHEKERMIRLPAHTSERLSTVMRATNRLCAELDREPTIAEVAKAAKMTEGEVEALLEASIEVTSLDTPIGMDRKPLGDFLPDDDALSPEEFGERADTARRVAEALATLRDREREVLALRFGFDGGGPRWLSEIADAMGISRERARQIETAALKRLRERHAHLMEYWKAS